MQRNRIFGTLSAIIILVAATVAAAPDTNGWKQLTFSVENVKSHEIGLRIEVFPDGRVVFSHGDGMIAPSVAQSLPALIAKIDAWSKRGPKVADKPTKAEYLMHLRLSAATDKEVVYAVDKLPAEEAELFKQIDALINSKQVPVACTKWEGKGDFTLTTWAQDYGVAAGPINRVTFKSDGAAERTINRKVDKAAKATASEIAAIRSALVAVDLGHFQDVFGGGGNGSNLRTVTLTVGPTSCSRSFTNKWPVELKSLQDALAPVTKRLDGRS
jgi:hypothetical protein